MNIKTSRFVEICLSILSIAFILVQWVSGKYYLNAIAWMILIIDIYFVIKSRKNQLDLFIFVSILYFDYSFIISKYLSSTPNMQLLFEYIKYDNSMFIGIASVYLLHAIMLLLIKSSLYEQKPELFQTTDCKMNDKQDEKRKNLFILALILLIGYILIDYLFLHFLPIKRTIYEYLLIPIIIATYYSKDSKLYRNLILILIIISTVVNTIGGGRIVSLQPLIAYFFTIFYDKITTKKLLLTVFLGILVFTIFGLYGDALGSEDKYHNLNFNSIKNTFIERKFALDTSISSYWTGMTFIETSNKISKRARLENFIQYITTYALFGKLSKYTELTDISRKYYFHYYGGYFTAFFYYWCGLAGIFIASIYISYLFNKISNVNKNSPDFKKILYIYVASSLPRWYLYYPAVLIRGLLLLCILYKISSMFIKHQKV